MCSRIVRVFTASEFVVITPPSFSFVPPGVEVPAGVGNSNTGRYRSEEGDYFTFNRTNTYSELGYLHGLGQMTIRIGADIVVTVDYTVRLLTSIPDSWNLDTWTGHITSLTVEGCPRKGAIEMLPINLGQSLQMTLTIADVN